MIVKFKNGRYDAPDNRTLWDVAPMLKAEAFSYGYNGAQYFVTDCSDSMHYYEAIEYLFDMLEEEIINYREEVENGIRTFIEECEDEDCSFEDLASRLLA